MVESRVSTRETLSVTEMERRAAGLILVVA